MANSSWLSVAGKTAPELEQQLAQRVADRVAAKKFSADNLAYISKVTFHPVARDLEISEQRLERLRRLCQLWDVKLLPAQISSHRKLVGPIIVALKKLVYPVLRAFLKDTLHQQRSFNAAAVALLAELSDEVSARKDQDRKKN